MVSQFKREMHFAIDPELHSQFADLSHGIGLSRNEIVAELIHQLVSGDQHMREMIIRRINIKCAGIRKGRIDKESMYDLIQGSDDHALCL